MTGPEASPRIVAMKPLLPRCGAFTGLVLAFALALCSAVAGAERPTVYRWLDESGVAHYTTQRSRIPSEFRDAAQEVGATSSPPQAATPSLPAAPPPAQAATPSTSPAAAAPPPVAAPPPSGPRVTPEGDFEEPPLGSHGAAPTSGASPSTRERDADVAAPPPGLVRGTSGSRGAPPTASPSATASVPREPSVAPSPLSATDASALDDRIALLEEQVSRDQAAIQSILGEPRESDGARLADRPDLREIAGRLPKLQADLKALRAQRARQTGP